MRSATFQAILRWANMLSCRLKVGTHVLWFHFSNSISRERLYVFPMLIWWSECIIWRTKSIGKCYAQQNMKGWRLLLCADSATSPGFRRTELYFLGTCYPGYRWRIKFPVPLPTLLQSQSYLVPCILGRTFIIPKLRNIYCEIFLSARTSSSLFILLGIAIAFSFRIGAFGNTFLMLFQLKWFFIVYDQLIQAAFFVVTPQDWCLIRWILLLSGFRSVLVNATYKTSQTKNSICVQGLGSKRPIDLFDRFQRELRLHKKKVLPQLWLRSLIFERIASYVTNTQKI